MLLLRVLLRYRRPPLPVPAAGFFTSSGSNATAPPPHLGAEGPRNEPGQEGSLARRVERAASVGAAMRGWMADGRAVHRGHVFHAINRLRRHRLHRTALQVMEWIVRERPYKLSELDYLYLLEFTAKVHGISEAESLFLRVPQEYQKELLYNNLVMAALDLDLIKHSYAYMRKIRELSLPISTYVYNRLIILHSSPNRRKTISKILSQMKADREKELKRTWEIMQDLPHIRSKSFTLAIEAFGKVGSIDQAEKIWVQIKSTKKLSLTEQFNSILSVYCRHGVVDKASSIFKEMRANGCQPNAITYRHLALGCLKSGLVKEALNTIDMGKKEVVTKKVRSSTPWLETTHLLLENFAEIGDLENAKRLYSELNESKYSRNYFVYNTLLKAYVKAKVYEPDLLRTMILRGAMPDAFLD
ncbi:unnamed protein product [Miscanthus lutarioriparius]|uniref:Pentatricopeptide repeat-containing protein n=1 Tax=Miscanthus lutarioriparius TaxID=422564 RepID=A0A811PHD2_9POAL|nr:unnamed protein product [Miscanthus lutarioriparius]